MIKYYFEAIFGFKKRLILIAALIVIIAYIVLETKFYLSVADQLLSSAEYRSYYQDTVIRIVDIFLMLVLGLILMNHDSKWQQVLVVKKGRIKAFLAKYFVYFLTINWIYLLILGFYYISPILITKYYVFEVSSLLKGVSMLFSGHIISAFYLLVIREKRRFIVFMLAIVFIIIKFIGEDKENLILYYLLPIANTNSSFTLFGMLYKLVYLFLLGSFLVTQSFYEQKT